MVTPRSAASATLDLFRLSISLFLCFLTIGLPLPVIPLYVHNVLGLSNTLVGLSVGIQFLATVLTRKYAGGLADRNARRCKLQGMLSCGLAGVLYLLSALLPLPPLGRLALLLIGRLVLGFGESQLITGQLTWGFGLVGPNRAGKVMSWTGMAISAAFAVGAPLGLWLNLRWGFAALGLSTMLLPLLTWFMDRSITATAPHPGVRVPMSQVLASIWQFGLALGMQGVGFAVLGAFVSLMFYHNGWANAGLALTCFGACFVAVRLVLGHLPDQIGGLRVAVVSLAIEAAGLLLLCAASSPVLAFAGAAITGVGCSLMFPALGVEVIRRVPPQVKGTAMGAFAAFQDIAYAVTGPVAGAVATAAGYPAVFALAAACAVGGVAIGLNLVRTQALPQ